MLREELKAVTSTRKDLRNFGLVVGGVFALIGGLLLWKERPAAPWFLGIGGVLVLFGALLPGPLKPVQRAWMAMAVVMGWVMTRVILSILFFLVLTPLSLVARLVGKHFLDSPPAAETKSYWHVRDGEEFDRTRYEKQF